MPNAQDQINTRAIEIAAEARARIDRHEDECIRRYDRVANTLDGLEKSLKEGFEGVHSRINKLAKEQSDTELESAERSFKWKTGAYVAVITVLLAIVAYLITSGTPWVQRIPAAAADTFN